VNQHYLFEVRQMQALSLTVHIPTAARVGAACANPATGPIPASGYAIGASRSLSGSACASWWREVMSSLVKTLPRWYWTVCGLRNS
jgi:hypothetical protein